MGIRSIYITGGSGYVGDKPVFVDCDDTFCMNVDLLEAAIIPRTKAIVPVHFASYMTDMRKLLPIAEKMAYPSSKMLVSPFWEQWMVKMLVPRQKRELFHCIRLKTLCGGVLEYSEQAHKSISIEFHE